jgi:hypothetical protein
VFLVLGTIADELGMCNVGCGRKVPAAGAFAMRRSVLVIKQRSRARPDNPLTPKRGVDGALGVVLDLPLGVNLAPFQ